MNSIFSMTTGTLTVILVFAGLIFFHELGHFLVARFFGMGVQTFSLGFGKPLFARRIGQTTYQVALIPLGGFVSLVGEATDAQIPEGFTEKDSFALRPAWQRACVVAAGAIFNLILAFILCWAMVVANGKTEALPEVGTLSAESPALHAGMQPGDTIVSINDVEVRSWADIPEHVQGSNGSPLTIVVSRDGTSHTLTVTPTMQEVSNIIGEKQTTWLIGITPTGATRTIELSFFAAAGAGFDSAINMVKLTWKVLVGLVKGSVPANNLGGPISIVKVIYSESDKGFTHILLIAAFISVNLGILNLLPVPVLDGGHLVFLAFEMIFRRSVSVAIREKAAMVGIVLLFSLMIYATYNDVGRIFGFVDSAVPEEKAKPAPMPQPQP